MNKEKAKELIDAFTGKRIMVVGDLMLDEYVCGSVSRISPEAPVPVVRVIEEHARPGGSANVALNIQALGGQAVLAGILGKDKAASDLLALLSEQGIETRGVLTTDQIHTTIKTRIIADRQQVVRVDRESDSNAARCLMPEFSVLASDLVDEVDAVIIEDYGKGAISQEIVDALLSKTRSSGKLTGFDPKDNHDLNIEGVAFATPNYKEACLAVGLPEVPLTGNLIENQTLAQLGERLLYKWNLDSLVVTLGSQGMYLLGRKQEPAHIPTRAQEVFDVSGAGDTVIAVTTLALAAGSTFYEAASLANYAAGVVVGKLGAETCTPEELLSSVETGRISGPVIS